ncbi:MAG: flagellar motor protein MotB [Lachnospiraceae bacterium]|nr:flagellar motor protein MotB [Lachnospiraceae bacterium]
MAKKREEDPPAGAPAWMATFSDLMNLLLCFFVLLFSMSSTDVNKFEAIAASLQKTFSVFQGGNDTIGEGDLVGNGVSQLNQLSEYFTSMGKNSTGNVDNTDSTENAEGVIQFQKEDLAEDDAEKSKGREEDESGRDASEEAETEITNEQAKEQLEQSGLQMSEELAEKIEEVLQEEDLDKQIDIDFTSQYVTLTMNGSLLFDSGSDTIKADAVDTLTKVGKILETFAYSTIEVEGHTDNIPISNARFANNDELSDARALSVFAFLRDNSDLDPAYIKHTGRGDYVPIADNGTPEGRQLNRRVEIRIYNQLSDVS